MLFLPALLILLLQGSAHVDRLIPSAAMQSGTKFAQVNNINELTVKQQHLSQSKCVASLIVILNQNKAKVSVPIQVRTLPVSFCEIRYQDAPCEFNHARDGPALV